MIRSPFDLCVGRGIGGEGLTRRIFVSRALAAGLVFPSVVSGAEMVAAQAATPDANPNDPGSATVVFDHLGGDAWAWEKELTGTCSGCPAESTIELRINEAAFPAVRVGDTFSATVRFEPGENQVVAAASLPDGQEVLTSPVSYTVRLEPRPTARLAAKIDGDRVIFDGTASEPSEYDAAAIEQWSIVWREDGDPPHTFTAIAPGSWSVAVPANDGEYYSRLTVEDAHGRSDAAVAYFVVEDGVARVPDPVHERAAWIADAVVYGTVPRFFDPPNLSGVTARLDDLADLGVSALWFSPITRTLPGDFGYAVTNYFEIRSDYGSNDVFKRLVSEAHARGLRVLMDFVPNHTSVEHPYFQDAEANGEASSYWDFYDRDPGGNPTYYFDWFHLPNLNYDNPEVQRFMLEAFAYWVREVDVDGFRVDAVWGIKERKPEWIDTFLAEMNRIKPNTLLIAEASARDEFYFERGFDAAYDWTDELGHWAWGDALGGIAPIGQAMLDVLTDGGTGYHEDALVMRFLNNNDTGARLISSYGLDLYRVALAMLLTLPGLPCLFTGDDVGAEYQPYEQPGTIDWKDHAGVRNDTKKLIRLRRDVESLHSRHWIPLSAEPASPLFAYLRMGADGANPVVVVLNFSASDLQAAVELPAEVGRSLASGQLSDLWSGEEIQAPQEGRLKVDVPGWSFRMVTHVDA